MKSETYTFREALDRLGLKSKGAFYRLENKYPEVFVIVNKGSGMHIRYHKDTLNRFVMMREYFIKGNYEPHHTKKRTDT